MSQNCTNNERLERIWAVKGDAAFAVNLDRATLEVLESGQERNRVRLTLPAPEVEWARVDHERTELYELNENNASVFTIWGAPDDLHELAMKDAQRAIFVAADQAEYLDQAKDHTEVKLTAICRDLGCDAEIVWQASP